MSRFNGVLYLTPTEALLDQNTLMQIADPDCADDVCRARRAHDYFANQGLDTGSPVSVRGTLVGGVLTIVREQAGGAE
jgi:hypothetical protein